MASTTKPARTMKMSPRNMQTVCIDCAWTVHIDRVHELEIFNSLSPSGSLVCCCAFHKVLVSSSGMGEWSSSLSDM